MLFCHSVCPFILNMECDRGFSLNTKEVAEQRPELKYKNYSMITDDKDQKAVILHLYVNNYFN